MNSLGNEGDIPAQPEQVTRASSQDTIHPLMLRTSVNKAMPQYEQDPAPSSDVPSDVSSDFDRAHPSYDIDDTPATFQDDVLSGRSDAGCDDSVLLSSAIVTTNGESTVDRDVIRVDKLHEEIAALFEKFLPSFQTQESHGDSNSEPMLPSRNLPALLTEFERQRGYALIDPKVYTQLEVFIAENPEVPITSHILVNLIHALESSSHSAVSEEHSPRIDTFSDSDIKSPANGSQPVGSVHNDGLSDASQDEYLVRDADSSRDLSRELNAEDAIILDLREDLRMEREKSDALLHTLSDKERKINSLEHKLMTLQEQHEESMLEEQSHAEELSNQMHSLKKDEKESRIKLEEVQQLTTSYELELAALTSKLEAAEKANTRLKRDLEDELDAAQSIKEDLNGRLQESRELSAYLEECETAKRSAEQTVFELKQDLDKAFAEGARLQRYQEEAEALRATTDQLETELDEIRRMAALHTTDSTMHQHSNPATLSRRLGNELAQRLEQVDSSEDDTQVDEKEEMENVDDFIETVIQRRRRRRVGKAQTSIEFATQGVQTEAIHTVSRDTSPISVHNKIARSASLVVLWDKKVVPLLVVVSLLVAIFASGASLGLFFNTSRDIYHVNQLSLDAEHFRHLNFPSNASKISYYDSRYPNAVVGRNFVDDVVGPVLDTVMSLVRPVRMPRRGPRTIYY